MEDDFKAYFILNFKKERTEVKIIKRKGEKR